MRKTVLMLINGFGVERKDSAPIFSHELMPNLDDYTKKYLFGTLSTTAADFNTGYTNFSIPPQGEEEVDSFEMDLFNGKVSKMPAIQDIQSRFTNQNTLHIICGAETEDKFTQIRNLMRLLNPDGSKNLFLHFVLDSPNLETYDSLTKLFTKFSFDNKRVYKLGFVVGKNNFNSDDTFRLLLREQGESWPQYDKKFEILKNSIVRPEDAPPFKISPGFTLKENDLTIFLNYNDIDITRYKEEASKLKMPLYSLYPLGDCPYLYEKAKNEKYFTSILSKFNINIMLLSTQDKVNTINYCVNGAERVLSDKIVYILRDDELLSNKDAVINLVESTNKDGYIIDYDIGGYTRIEEMKDELHRIDAQIKNVCDACQEKGYTLIISSLYGMHKTMREGVIDKVVNFSGLVPCIFINNEYNRENYSVGGTSTTGLMYTYLTNICDDVRANKMLHKKSALDKLLKK